MAQIDEDIKRQLDKPQVWFCKYFPKRIQNVGEKETKVEQKLKIRLFSDQPKLGSIPWWAPIPDIITDAMLCLQTGAWHGCPVRGSTSS